eukprot:TRINITY_DN1349_c0_g1_i7.p2 TRINITY_DN1349_c0_g1~~TRINITY_DN1349_c0_g1_i7.p2  ORF type:complete len:193 (+),score=-29.40 TRINITY_DN1349_c0_g1_i7:1015-1593(+)
MKQNCSKMIQKPFVCLVILFIYVPFISLIFQLLQHRTLYRICIYCRLSKIVQENKQQIFIYVFVQQFCLFMYMSIILYFNYYNTEHYLQQTDSKQHVEQCVLYRTFVTQYAVIIVLIFWIIYTMYFFVYVKYLSMILILYMYLSVVQDCIYCRLSKIVQEIKQQIFINVIQLTILLLCMDIYIKVWQILLQL